MLLQTDAHLELNMEMIPNLEDMLINSEFKLIKSLIGPIVTVKHSLLLCKYDQDFDLFYSLTNTKSLLFSSIFQCAKIFNLIRMKRFHISTKVLQ